MEAEAIAFQPRWPLKALLSNLARKKEKQRRSSEIAGLQARILDARSIIEAIQFTRNARILVAGDYAGHIWVWETNTGKAARAIRASHFLPAKMIGLSTLIAPWRRLQFRDGKKLAALSSGGYFGYVRASIDQNTLGAKRTSVRHSRDRHRKGASSVSGEGTFRHSGKHGWSCYRRRRFAIF